MLGPLEATQATLAQSHQIQSLVLGQGQVSRRGQEVGMEMLVPQGISAAVELHFLQLDTQFLEDQPGRFFILGREIGDFAAQK
jgi:hypothetical protein